MGVALHFPVDGEVGKEQQDDGGGYGDGEQPHGQRLCFGYLSFPMPEGGLCLRVEVADEAVQFPVQRPVTVTQAIGVGIHFRCLPLLQGYQAVAELVQFFGGGKYLHGSLAAESPGYAFFLLLDGTHTGGTSRHFGQVVHQEAVRLVLTGKDFRQVKQVGFLFSQEGAQGVYLFRLDVLPAMELQGLQQAVGTQAEGAVTGAVGLFPADDTSRVASRVMRRCAVLMSRRTCRISADSASISLIRSRSCTKMAAMLAMTATVVSTNADILSCNFLCSNALCLVSIVIYFVFYMLLLYHFV